MNQETLISEKLYDSYLGLAFPFNYGGSNVKAFSEDTYRSIDVLDIKKSIEVIEKGIKENLLKNYESIKQSRNLVIENIISSKEFLKLLTILKRIQIKNKGKGKY